MSADDGSRIIDHGDGCFVFLPAASGVFHLLFLTALLILAAGITGLQVAANPYVDLLGSRKRRRDGWI
jgi:FHS family L-fucose permease-like MFS transporter